MRRTIISILVALGLVLGGVAVWLDIAEPKIAEAQSDFSSGGGELSASILVLDNFVDGLELEIPSTNTWGDGASADASAGQNVIANFVDTVEADVLAVDDFVDTEIADILTDTSTTLDDFVDGLEIDTANLLVEIPDTDTWGDGNDADASAGQQSIYNGLDGGDTTVNRRAGNRQVLSAAEASLACNGGLAATIATTAGAAVVIDSVIVYGNADLPGADCVMQVQCGVGGNDQVMLEYADADLANAGDTASSLDAATGLDTSRLSPTDTCRVINTAGTNAGAQSVQVVITYYAEADGGFLAP